MSGHGVESALSFDTDLFREVNDLARSTPLLHSAATGFAVYGVVLFGGLLLVSWWRAREAGGSRRVAAALWAPLGVLLAVAVNQPIVNLTREPRPYTAMTHVEVLVARSADYSFPSDHAVMAGAVAAGVLLVDRRLGLVATLAAVVMAAVRVYVGAHYPHDVLAGLLLGAAVAVVSERAVRPVTTRFVAAVAGSRLRPFVQARPAERALR